MTSRLNHYPVSERRLKPIYDWLDNGNNKKALQEADKVLKKQPNLQCAKVLKCLALLRLGKESDCFQQLEAIKEECPVEEASLQAMTVCYREIHKPHLICDLYEKANVKEPGNEEILTNLFLSYVRVGDYKKQQQTAMALYKVKKKNQYYFWCVISILLQAVDKLSDLIHACLIPSYNYNNVSSILFNDVNPVLCTLAEKMLEKFVNEDKVETEQEILIYLTSLELQAKTERALEVLNGPLGGKLEPYIVLNKRVNLLIKLGKWEEVNELIMQVLEKDIDSWNYYLFYLDSVFELGKDKIIDHLVVEHCPFFKAKSFIRSLIKQNEILLLRKRGPYLAQLEYYSRLVANNYDAQKLLGNIVELLVQYYQDFGSKECCVHDLRPYFTLLTENDSSVEFLLKVSDSVHLPENKMPDTKQQMDFLICSLECDRVISLQDKSVDEKYEFISKAVNYFIYSLKFNVDLQSTEVRSSDRFALLALHLLFELWLDTEDSNYLFEAIVICQYALTHSSSNSQFKTLLLKFYHLLGGCKGAHSAYLQLDVKHMQLDTLGYLHVFPLLSNGDYASATEVISTTMKFFTNNFKESADHITFAYKYDALTKIPEFIWVREKLNHSTHYIKIRFERMLLDIFFAASHSNTLQLIKDFEINPLDKIQWNILQDNRDFSVLWNIDRNTAGSFERDCIKHTYNHDLIYLRLRCILLHIIAASMYAGLGEPNNVEGEIDSFDIRESLYNYNVSKSILKKLLVDLEENLEPLKNNVTKTSARKFIAAPPESRLLLIVQCNYFDLVLAELKLMIELVPGSDCDKIKCDSLLNDISLFCEDFVNNLSYIAGSKNPAKRADFIQMAAIYVELIAFTAIIVGVAENVARKLKQNLAKKNRKKREPVQKILNSDGLDWRVDIINRLIAYITDNVKQVESILKTEEKFYSDRGILMGDVRVCQINYKKEENLVNSLKSSVNDCLISSYSSSLSQVINLLKVKLKYLTSHKI